MENKKQNAIFYIEKDKGSLYVSGKDVLVMRFPKDIVSNLEIIDSTKFQQMIVHFMSSNEIKQMQVLVVLGPDVIFEIMLDDIALSLQHIEKEKFLDVVPFDKILTKTFQVHKKTQIIAANKDFAETLVDTLQEESWSVVGVVAFSSIQKKLPEVKEANDLPHILKKIDTFKSVNLLMIVQEQEGGISYKVPSLKNPQFIALVIVFVVLISVLGFQIYTQFLNQKTTIVPVTVKKEVKRIPIPLVTSPTAAPASESAQVDVNKK
jgi:hypothetical protein